VVCGCPEGIDPDRYNLQCTWSFGFGMRVAVVDEGRANAAAEQQLGWLLETVGLSALDGLGWIRVTGEDRVRWLNGMVTNSITELKPGEGNYSFALNAQGRIQGDLTAFAEAEALWLETARDRVPAMMALLDHYIIMDDVELSDVSLGRSRGSAAGEGGLGWSWG
jgi:glycine cleavage system aminomethyltransferase T